MTIWQWLFALLIKKCILLETFYFQLFHLEYKNRKLLTHFINFFILCRYGPGGLVRSLSLRSLASRQAPWKKKIVVKWIPHINTVNQKWESHSKILGEKRLVLISNILRRPQKFENKIQQFWCYRLKRTQDISISSQIKQKFEEGFFVDLFVLYKLWILNCSSSSANENKNNFMFATCTEHMNKQTINDKDLA